MRYLYNILITLILPLAFLRLFWRSLRNPCYRQRLGERLTTSFAFEQHSVLTQNLIWIHTVSVGEFLATLPLIEQLLLENKNLIITTTTPTGSAMVREKLGQRVHHQYLPFDAPFLVNRFLKKIQPGIAVFVETEIWVNYLHELNARQIPSLLINARLSEKSLIGYQKLGKLARDTVAKFTQVACQNEISCRRFQTLGAKALTMGNLKFDLHSPEGFDEKQSDLNKKLTNRSFILVASTHKGEEEIILDQYQKHRENRLLVIAPRHPERSQEVVSYAKKKGFNVERYTNSQLLSESCQVLVVDVLGQLLTFYSLADYAIIGGSFVPHGGHNPLEAALFATPCIIGEHFFNFESLVTDMRAEGAIEVVAVDSLFNKVLSPDLGLKAKAFLSKNQGATENYKELIKKTIMID